MTVIFSPVSWKDDIDLTWAWLTYNAARDGLELLNPCGTRKGLLMTKKILLSGVRRKRSKLQSNLQQQVPMREMELDCHGTSDISRPIAGDGRVPTQA